MLRPGESWRFTVAPSGVRRHRTDGAKSAYLTLADGSHVPVSVDDTLLSGRPAEPAPVLMPKGEVTEPSIFCPGRSPQSWSPGDAVPVALYPADGTSIADRQAMQTVGALTVASIRSATSPSRRQRFTRVGRCASGKARPRQGGLCALAFGADIELSYGDGAGRQYGLTALAQLLHGARDAAGDVPFSGERHHRGLRRAMAGAAAIWMSRGSFIW